MYHLFRIFVKNNVRMYLIENHKKYILLPLLLLCVYVFAFPQQFSRLNEDQGLSSRRCYAVCQDKNGFMWIATKLSIDRYDGREIVHYELTSPDKQVNNNIGANFVCLSPDSVVWVFTQSGYIYYYDERTDAFVFVYSIRDFYQSYNVILNSIFFENKNILLLATRRGVLKFDLAKKIVSDCNIFHGHEVNYIEKYKDLHYFATRDGLLIIRFYNNDNAEIVNHLLKGNIINHLYYDANYQQLWIGTVSDGMYILQDCKSKNLLSIQLKTKKPVRAITPYNETQLAVGIDGEGVFLVNRRTLQTEQAFVWDENQPKSIGSNSIWDLFVDNQKIMWVATYHGGISFSDCSNMNFRSVVHEKQNINSVISNYINKILEDRDGDLWFGTNNGLSLLNKNTNKWKHFFNSDDLSDKNIILTLCEDSFGKIWAGGYAFGVASIDKKTGNIKRFYATDTKPIIGTDYVYSIYKDEYSGNLWIGGIYGKISCYNPTTNTSQLYNEESLRCFCNYNDSMLLLGLNTGLYLMNKNTGKKQPTKLCLPINDILKDGDRCYWIGTMANGLYYYDMKTDLLNHYTKAENGLPSNYVYAIKKDEDNCLWISTEMGLVKLNPKNDKIISFDKQDGLISNLFIPCASVRCSDNRMIFGSADGAVEFYPSEIQKTKQQNYYRLIFTGFYLFGNSTNQGDKDSPLKIPVNNARKITLPYNKNYFSFSFSLPNYHLSEKTEYSYFLRGYDLDWSQTSTIHSISYSKIQPGKYTFMVRVYVDKQLLEERHIDIIVCQPWWNSVWAWIAYLFIIITIIVYLVNYYSERAKKKQTREKMDFFINTAHDILTPLSLIEAPLKDISAMDTLTEEAKYLLSLALNNTMRLNRFVYQLIDFQKINLDASHLLVSKNNIKLYFTGKWNDYSPIASQKFITLDVYLPETEKEVLFDKEKIGKILDNLLSNAIKYTPFGGKIEINISFLENEWSFTVKDTGPGIPKKNQNLIFKYIFRVANDVNNQNVGSGVGLKMVYALVCIHQGKITFNSKKGEGTEFTITLPYSYDEKFIDASNPVEFNRQEKKADTLVFIVVSDTEVASYLHNLLSHDYCVETYNTGTEACNSVTRIQPKLILVDYLLTDMDGFSFCKKIKDNPNTIHIPILFISNHIDKETSKKIFNSGAIDYIRKPFESEIITLQIANLLNLQQVWQDKTLTDIKKNNMVAMNNERDQEFMDNLIQLIETNLDNPDLNISMLCKELALSRTLLYNRITQLTGNSANEFIRIIRLKNAANMLISGQYTITEVALMVGFDNPKYFSRIFKDYYKVAPKNYLKEP